MQKVGVDEFHPFKWDAESYYTVDPSASMPRKCFRLKRGSCAGWRPTLCWIRRIEVALRRHWRSALASVTC